MTDVGQEQLGMPPTAAMRQLLDENRAFVRLLSAGAANHDVEGTEPEPCAESDTANALISAYREVLDLLEILSATSAPRTGGRGYLLSQSRRVPGGHGLNAAIPRQLSSSASLR